MYFAEPFTAGSCSERWASNAVERGVHDGQQRQALGKFLAAEPACLLRRRSGDLPQSLPEHPGGLAAGDQMLAVDDDGRHRADAAGGEKGLALAHFAGEFAASQHRAGPWFIQPRLSRSTQQHLVTWRPRVACAPYPVRVAVLAACSQCRRPATRCPVSSKCTTGAAVTAAAICSTAGVSVRRAAAMRAWIVPGDIAHPHRAPSTARIRSIGSSGYRVGYTAAALIVGPHCTGRSTPSGNAPRCHWPQAQRTRHT